MAGQLRMTEEEKKAKMKVKYDQEVEDIQSKILSKGFTPLELAKQYGTPI